jgi:hypothetical protein
MILKQRSAEISIHQLLDVRPKLRLYLTGREFKQNSVRSYSNFLRILLAKARNLGWSEYSAELEGAWEEIRRVAARNRGCPGIALYAIRHGKKPAEFTEPDLSTWREATIRDGRSAGYLAAVTSHFKKAAYAAGQGPNLPQLDFSQKTYGLPLSKFAEPLRGEVLALLDWKTAEFSPGRPRRARYLTSPANRWTLA